MKAGLYARLGISMKNVGLNGEAAKGGDSGRALVHATEELKKARLLGHFEGSETLNFRRRDSESSNLDLIPRGSVFQMF